jgi:hypothetical protein
MQTAKTYEDSPSPIVIGNLVRSLGVGDIDLNYHKIRVVIEGEGRNMFIDDNGLVVGR